MSANIAIQTETANSVVNYAASVINDKQKMTSLQIAEITGKQHAHVMRDIRNMIENLNKSNESTFGLVGSEYHRGDRAQYKYLSERTQNILLDFAMGNSISAYQIVESAYLDAKGEKRTMYVLNKKACFLLASGYDVVLRAKIIDRWEVLEKAEADRYPKVPTTFKEALLLAVAQQEQIEQQQALIAEQADAIGEMQPKVNYCDVILQSPSTVTVTQIAQDYGKSAKAFNKLLHELGIQRKVGRQWVLYADNIKNGYVQSATEPMRNSDTGRTYTYSRWTQKGRLFLYHELKNRGVLPLMEQI